MIILDIETVANKDCGLATYKAATIQAPSNYKDEDKKNEYIAKARLKLYDELALSPLTGKICLVGMMSDSSNPLFDDSVLIDDTKLSYLSAGFDGTTEYQLIERSLKAIASYIDDGSLIITYNGKKFDLPFLIQRAMILGIPRPQHFPNFDTLCGKYNNRTHYDLFDWLNPNYGSYSQLREWSYVMNHTDDLSDSGGNIELMYADGKFEEIKQKNKRDLLKTYYLYNAIKDWMI